MRQASTYRADRRNACLHTPKAGVMIWSPQWYFKGTKKAKAHTATIRYEPKERKVKMTAYEKKSGVTLTEKISVPGNDPYHFYPVFSALGGFVFGRSANGALDPNKVGLDNKTFLANVAKYAPVWQKNGLFSNYAGKGAGAGGFDLKGNFQTGKSAVLWTGPWNAGKVFSLRDVKGMKRTGAHPSGEVWITVSAVAQPAADTGGHTAHDEERGNRIRPRLDCGNRSGVVPSQGQTHTPRQGAHQVGPQELVVIHAGDACDPPADGRSGRRSDSCTYTPTSRRRVCVGAASGSTIASVSPIDRGSGAVLLAHARRTVLTSG